MDGLALEHAARLQRQELLEELAKQIQSLGFGLLTSTLRASVRDLELLMPRGQRSEDLARPLPTNVRGHAPGDAVPCTPLSTGLRLGRES